MASAPSPGRWRPIRSASPARRRAARASSPGSSASPRCDPALAVTAEAWNADPLRLGTPAGTIDLATGALAPADPAEGICLSTAVAPAECADCPAVAALPRRDVRRRHRADRLPPALPRLRADRLGRRADAALWLGRRRQRQVGVPQHHSRGAGRLRAPGGARHPDLRRPRALRRQARPAARRAARRRRRKRRRRRLERAAPQAAHRRRPGRRAARQLHADLQADGDGQPAAEPRNARHGGAPPPAHRAVPPPAADAGPRARGQAAERGAGDPALDDRGLPRLAGGGGCCGRPP